MECAVLVVVLLTLIGRRNPAIKSDHDAMAQTAKPGKNELEISRKAPTNMGEINMANPLNVRNDPQTTATLSGVMPCICMGSVSKVGTYSQEPILSKTTEGYINPSSGMRNAPKPPTPANSPDATKRVLGEVTRSATAPPASTANTPTNGSIPVMKPACDSDMPRCSL